MSTIILPPTRPLFKYLPSERDSYFENELLRFCQPCDLNDPFECMPKVTEVDIEHHVGKALERNIPRLIEKGNALPEDVRGKIPEEIRKMTAAMRQEYLENPDLLPKKFLDYYLERANQTIGIFSLSGVWNNPLMWAHYTTSHTGFCVGFDSEHSFFKRQATDPQDIGSLVEVGYGKERVKVQIRDSVVIEPELFERKDEIWKYEEEFRLVRPLSSASETIDRPNKVPLCLFKVPHEAVCEVIVGSYATPETTKKIIGFCESKKIPAFRIKPSLKTFGFERTLLPEV